jgi:hypothetical protein
MARLDLNPSIHSNNRGTALRFLGTYGDVVEARYKMQIATTSSTFLKTFQICHNFVCERQLNHIAILDNDDKDDCSFAPHGEPHDLLHSDSRNR